MSEVHSLNKAWLLLYNLLPRVYLLHIHMFCWKLCLYVRNYFERYIHVCALLSPTNKRYAHPILCPSNKLVTVRYCMRPSRSHTHACSVHRAYAANFKFRHGLGIEQGVLISEVSWFWIRNLMYIAYSRVLDHASFAHVTVVHVYIYTCSYSAVLPVYSAVYCCP